MFDQRNHHALPNATPQPTQSSSQIQYTTAMTYHPAQQQYYPTMQTYRPISPYPSQHYLQVPQQQTFQSYSSMPTYRHKQYAPRTGVARPDAPPSQQFRTQRTSSPNPSYKPILKKLSAGKIIHCKFLQDPKGTILIYDIADDFKFIINEKGNLLTENKTNTNNRTNSLLGALKEKLDDQANKYFSIFQINHFIVLIPTKGKTKDEILSYLATQIDLSTSVIQLHINLETINYQLNNIEQFQESRKNNFISSENSDHSSKLTSNSRVAPSIISLEDLHGMGSYNTGLMTPVPERTKKVEKQTRKRKREEKEDCKESSAETTSLNPSDKIKDDGIQPQTLSYSLQNNLPKTSQTIKTPRINQNSLGQRTDSVTSIAGSQSCPQEQKQISQINPRNQNSEKDEFENMIDDFINKTYGCGYSDNNPFLLFSEDIFELDENTLADTNSPANKMESGLT